MKIIQGIADSLKKEETSSVEYESMYQNLAERVSSLLHKTSMISIQTHELVKKRVETRSVEYKSMYQNLVE